MTDYSATALQPIVQGIIQAASAAGPVSFQGRGVSLIQRTPTPGQAQGDYCLTLDAGLPGSGAVADSDALPAGGVIGSVIGNPRSAVTVRGGSGGNTTITQAAVSYGNFVAGVFTVADEGDPITVVRVVLSIAGTGADPLAAVGNGAEVVVWKSQDSVSGS